MNAISKLQYGNRFGEDVAKIAQTSLSVAASSSDAQVAQTKYSKWFNGDDVKPEPMATSSRKFRKTTPEMAVADLSIERIEMQPIPEQQVRRMFDYVTAAAYGTRDSRHGFRIPAIVVDDWAKNGYCILRTNTLARTYGVGRKTMWKTIKGVISAGFIKEVGRTPDGLAMYVPCLERGDEWRQTVGEQHGR